ncbi:MAG: hypothetical protein H6931_11265 [Burkholderiaceae bacterium]|nr:hypothetical protein [Burkholderiaceae bacterium]
MTPAEDDRDRAGMPCAFGMLAATMALMTSHAAPEPTARVDAETLRRLTVRKIVSNLCFLQQHPALPPALRRVVARLHARWIELAPSAPDPEVAPASPAGDARRVLHPKSGSYPVAGSRGGGLGGPMTGAMRSLM